MCACFRHLWRIISSTERCVKNRAYLPPLVGESVLPNGVTFCYPIPADPLVFHDPGTEKAAATQSDSSLMYPPGGNLWTRYTRVIVFTNSCQALILCLPAVLHTPPVSLYGDADSCVDVRSHARSQHVAHLIAVQNDCSFPDVGQMLVQHPLDSFQNAGLPVNN